MNPPVLTISREVLSTAVRHVGIGPIAETKLLSGDIALTSIAIDQEAEAFEFLLHLARIYNERGEDGYNIAAELARHLCSEWDGGVPCLGFLNVRISDS